MLAKAHLLMRLLLFIAYLKKTPATWIHDTDAYMYVYVPLYIVYACNKYTYIHTYVSIYII